MSGRTTTIKAVNGLEPVRAGRITVDATSVTDASTDKILPP